MSLILTSLEKAVAQLDEALSMYSSDMVQSNPGLKKHMRSAAIQAFGYTYELSIKMIKRYVRASVISTADVDTMTFNRVIREAYRIGVVRSELSVWRRYREKRGIASHTYDEDRAQSVFEDIPDFLDDAKYVLTRLREMNDQ